jgi:hypothetical protein
MNRIKIDHTLDQQKSKKLWQFLENFANVFTWNL